MRIYVRILVIGFFIFSSYFYFSQESKKIKWYSFEEAVELNKKHPKKIFVDVYTSWCGWCKKMDVTTFSHPDVVEYMNKHYYSVKLNAESSDTIVYQGNVYVNLKPGVRRSSHQFAVALLQGKMSYPSYVFLNEKFQLLSVVPGYLSVQRYEPIIKYFGEDFHLSKSWADYQKTFINKFKL